MSDEEFIASVIKAREEAVEFFSSARKAERERWVVNELLDNLGVPHREGEIVSFADEPPDVLYADARFEVKEIMDPGKRRHAEYKASLEKAKRAKVAADLFDQCTPKDITYTEVCALVERHIGALRPYAPSTRITLDLLFYVNLEDVRGYVGSELAAAAEFQRYGWRSVSFVAGPMGVVLYADSSAPSFLRAVAGKVVRQQRGGADAGQI